MCPFQSWKFDACSAVVDTCSSRLLKVRASYLEVYEDRIYDLLDVSNRDKPVEEWATVTPLDDGEGNKVLKGLTTFEVDNEGEKSTNEEKEFCSGTRAMIFGDVERRGLDMARKRENWVLKSVAFACLPTLPGLVGLSQIVRLMSRLESVI